MQHKVIERRSAQPDGLDRTTVDALGKLVRLVVLIVTALIIAQTVGIKIGGLLALGGVGGLAVGLAAKDPLANLFGRLTIYLDRPFSEREWIRSPDRSIEGTVEYISWRHTRIRGFNKNPIHVPNAVFTTIVVENPSRMSHRRIREVMGNAVQRPVISWCTRSRRRRSGRSFITSSRTSCSRSARSLRCIVPRSRFPPRR